MGHLVTFSTLRTDESYALASSLPNAHTTNAIEDHSWLVIRVVDDHKYAAVSQLTTKLETRNKIVKASHKPQGMIVSLETLAAFDLLDRTQGIDVAVAFIKSL